MGKRTRTTIIRDNPDDEAEDRGSLVTREIENDTGEQSFSDFMSKNKGVEGCRVKVRRQTPQGREYCGSYLPEEIENAEEFLRVYHSKQTYAGEQGVYFVTVEVNGEARSVFPIRIAPQMATATAPMSGGMAESVALREQVRRLEERLMQREHTPMLEMVDGLAKLDQLRGGASGGNNLETIVKCIEIGTRMNGGGAVADGGWEGMLRDVLKDNAPAILGLLQMGARKLGEMTQKGPEPKPAQPPEEPPANPPIVGETMQPDEQERAILQQAIGFLKKKAAAHSDPGLYVDLIVDNREDPLYERLISKILDNDFSSFAELDPDIAKPEYRDFFGFIHDRIRHVFKPKNTVATATSGKARDKGNAAGNGTTGKSGG